MILYDQCAVDSRADMQMSMEQAMSGRLYFPSFLRSRRNSIKGEGFFFFYYVSRIHKATGYYATLLLC